MLQGLIIYVSVMTNGRVLTTVPVPVLMITSTVKLSGKCPGGGAGGWGTAIYGLYRYVPL